MKALLGAAATAHDPTPPASARGQATEPNSAAAAAQVVRYCVGWRQDERDERRADGGFTLQIRGNTKKQNASGPVIV